MDIQALIEPTVTGLGYELVALERVGRGLLRLYIDKPDGIVVDDCVRVSNQLTRLFAVENVDYDRLEVSSPGLDRPLVKAADYARFAGERAQLRLRLPVEGRKRFLGLLLGIEGDRVRLRTEAGEAQFALADIESARLAPDFETMGVARRKS
ncbi:MAG: ribosome maturation factor RimP [Thiobacillaceae bacterium]|jgi:ribosome maturation factor RimP|nr:ribosome maturation factor RimP [Thiobacillaceae bacterium]